MRKHFLIPILALIVVNTVQSQTRWWYIDMEYILQNVPNYAEASVQLEQSKKKKQEIESKKSKLTK
jgi:Skp family chaperone for outer membrane proteins